jgi:hypothetical protein
VATHIEESMWKALKKAQDALHDVSVSLYEEKAQPPWGPKVKDALAQVDFCLGSWSQYMAGPIDWGR